MAVFTHYCVTGHLENWEDTWRWHQWHVETRRRFTNIWCVYSGACICLPWRNSPSGPRPPNYRGLTITLRHTALGRTPLDGWSARRRDIYLKTRNTDKGQTAMHPAGFEAKIPSTERLQTHALDRTDTGTDACKFGYINYHIKSVVFVN
jgi:hypothetical protein